MHVASQMGKLIGSLEKQLTDKGEEINGYMEKHQIQVRGALQIGVWCGMVYGVSYSMV